MEAEEVAGRQLVTQFDRIGDADLSMADIQWLTKNITKALKEQRNQGLEDAFNLKETEKEWEKFFYESDWEPDTLNLTDTEKKITAELTTFLPRHMTVYDWNLPYAEEILLVIRRHLKHPAGEK